MSKEKNVTQATQTAKEPPANVKAAIEQAKAAVDAEREGKKGKREKSNWEELENGFADEASATKAASERTSGPTKAFKVTVKHDIKAGTYFGIAPGPRAALFTALCKKHGIEVEMVGAKARAPRQPLSDDDVKAVKEKAKSMTPEEIAAMKKRAQELLAALG